MIFSFYICMTHDDFYLLQILLIYVYDKNLTYMIYTF